MTKTWASGSGHLVIPAANQAAAIEAVRAALAPGGPLADVRAFDAWRTFDGPAIPDGVDLPDILQRAGFRLDRHDEDPAVILVEYDDEIAGITEVLDVLAPHITAGVITWEITSDGDYCKDRFGNGIRQEIPGRVVYADEIIGWIVDDLPGGLTRATFPDGSSTRIDWRRAATDRRYYQSLLDTVRRAVDDAIAARVAGRSAGPPHADG